MRGCVPALTGLLMAVGVVGTLAGSDAATEARRLVAAQRWNEAEVKLRGVLEDQPGDADACALLGMTLYHRAAYSEAVTHLDKALDSGTAYEARCLYYLGLACSKTGERDRARKAFTRLMSAHPDSPEAERLEGVSAELTTPISERRAFDVAGWLVLFESGYSSNSELVDGGDGDVFVDVYASGSVDRDGWPMTLGGSVFVEKFADLTEDDFLRLTGDVRRDFRLGHAVRLEGVGEVGLSWLDFEAYERHISLLGDVDRVFADIFRGEARGEVRLVQGVDDDLTSDGTELTLRLRGYRYWRDGGWLSRLRLELLLERNDRDVDADGFDRLLLGVEGRCRLPEQVSLDLGVEVEGRDYNGPEAGWDRARSDTTIELAAEVLRPLNRECALTGRIGTTTRDSNIDYYSADDVTLRIGLIWYN